MTRHGAKTYRKPDSTHDPKLEDRVKSACEWIKLQVPRRGLIKDASQKFSVPYYKLWFRCKMNTQAPRDAHSTQRTLDNTQEAVLAGWVKFWGDEGLPVDRMGLRIKAREISGGPLPSNEWVKAFKRRHPELKVCRSRGLDPARAHAFNRETVSDYFEKLSAALESYGIRRENIWNMDEKGCQMGGGRRVTNRKYFFSRYDYAKYKKRSANLELITVIECISADGHALPPRFIFPGGGESATYDRSWFDDHPGISYVLNFLCPCM